MGKNWIGVHVSKHLPESIDEQVWISCRAYQDIAIAETAESVWNKCLRLDGLLQSNISEITDDAHDFKIGVARSSGNLIEHIEFNLLADGTLVREILIGQRLIDYGMRRAAAISDEEINLPRNKRRPKVWKYPSLQASKLVVQCLS